MKKTYQIPNVCSNPEHGDCLRAAIASLLGIEYDEVPNFKEYGVDYFNVVKTFLIDHGYKYNGYFETKKYVILKNPISNCFNDDFFTEYMYDILDDNLLLSNYVGVDGYFIGVVLSPKRFSLFDKKHKTHAIICDQKLNIIFDPNESYSEILKYPLVDLLGHNGIVGIYNISKIT